ncbi:flocculation protein FLO11-like [Oryza brachyantha]|uniref:flocculation protein FLO11-like n=1 Tax=Oryza brachyantha TaxID=4533 RepID=UPI001ADBDEEB|nr:flocculation protein FLO11-like [Oryza brachyantha]
MASQDAAPQCRPGSRAATDSSASVSAEEFEFCVLPSGGLALSGGEEDAMCFADEVFSDGKLLPLRLSSANSVDAAALRLIRSDSLDGATTASSASGFSWRSDSRSASSSSSNSCCVSRSTSQKSASSDCAGRSSQPSKTATSDARRRPLPSSLFYAHPSPSPRPSQRWTGGSAAPAPGPAAARRSTGSAPPASWGLLRLGVVGAPDVYRPRPAAARGGSRSARFEQPSSAAKDTVALDKKLPLGFLGTGLVCNCSPDAVEPVGSAEVAAAARRRRRMAEEKNTRKVKNGQSTVRRSRILEWLEDLSISKDKNAA